MKKRMKWMVKLLVIAVLLSACKKEPVTPEAPKGDNATSVLTGKITKNRTLDKQEYILQGSVIVSSGATLTIPAGTKIISDKSDGLDVLIVDQGGKIQAEGTASEPIVFTSSVKDIGSWGGIVVLGKAPINVPGGISSPEFDVNLNYGGNQPEDNSGKLTYVRVEYAGAGIIEGSVEYNGFGFYGVGSGTIINHLETYKGSDDGYEFFGGTVVANQLISIGDEDDSFDWTEGWTGGGTDWIAIKEGLADKGIEADNNENDNTLQPMSQPTISQLTLIGIGNSDGMRLRRGTAGSFSNVVVKNFENGISVRDDQTILNIQTNILSVVGKIKDCVNLTSGKNSNGDGTDVSSVFTDNASATGANPSFTQGWSNFDKKGYSL